MSDMYFAVLMPVVYIFEGICADKLFRNFAEAKSSKYSAGTVWAVYQTACYFLTESRDGTDLLFMLLLNIAVMMLFSVMMNKGNFLQRIFPAVLFILIRELIVLSASCLTGLGDIISDTVIEMQLSGMISETDYNTAYMIFFSVICLVRIFFIYFVVNRLVNTGYFRQYLKIYLVPAMAGIIAAALIKMLIISIENGYTVLLYKKYPLLYFIIPMLSFALLSAVLIEFRQCRYLSELQTDREERIILENQTVQMRNSLAETERLYDNIRSVRHDMKNNMAVLQSILDKKCPDDGEIKQYFAEMSLSVNQLDTRIHTGNAVSDSIINGKFYCAEKLIPDIQLSGDDFIFKECGIKSYDAGIILSNGLDNAIEACVNMKRKFPERKAYITVRSFRKRNMYFIEIENSFDGFLKKDSADMPVSSKENAEFHGIGLRSIKKCAEKYSGGMDFTADGDKFILSVMMKEEKSCQ